MNSPSPEVDVFISNYTIVDPDVYHLWVNGYSATESVTILKQYGILEEMGTTLDLVASDILDHYRTYSLLEKLIHYPTKLDQQLAFQIEPQTKNLLIEKYYEIDDIVVREFLGKKLSSKHRKDLDEVSEKTSIAIKSCRRQFDNVKRVFKYVEELQGSVIQNISSTFLLSEDLAKKYGVIVFIACMRFETSKRKLQNLSFQDFYEPTLCIINKWTYPKNSPEFGDMDLDREFLLDLREVRILLDKEKDHKHVVCQKLKQEFLEKTYSSMETNFRMLSRAIIGIAYNLHHNRDMRSLFLDIMERIVDPWKVLNWNKTEIMAFLKVFFLSAFELDIFQESEVKKAWERYMEVITISIKQLY
ncbi:acidic fibroblast growth factor intracellular-binding protein isoform X1 [Daktulosphaira vitifoliae]|uniref:acidic fibroblast growth factor intracellular-binding protein isoform X1 n=1 Tax=Daktulosphaira vitifoliae TaxID=58002 RepID=UPI0021A9D075|nr:acidic fibroblast growth factor intracellular-binding protein isoform X1 [Daktulosphaira vitifoliae]